MGNWGTFIVQKGRRVWHRTEAKYCEAGEKINLDYLDADGVKKYLELGVVDAGRDVDLAALYPKEDAGPAEGYTRFEAFRLGLEEKEEVGREEVEEE